jgi:uncharacterized protein (TIGR00369 family)
VASADIPEGQAPYGSQDSEAWIRWADLLTGSRAYGLTFTGIQSSLVTATLEHSVIGLNPNGSCHGGLVAGAIDQMMGVTATTALGPSMVPVTASLHVQFFAPAIPSLRFDGRVVRKGSSIVSVDVDVFTVADGALCARGQGTMSPRRFV